MKHSTYPGAIARIRGGKEYPGLHGTVRFFQRNDGVLLEAELFGLPKTETGFFAFHIHEGSSCFGDGFSDTGGHFNPGGAMHPNHAGDLPPLLGCHGKAYMNVFTDRFCTEEIVGRTVIVHSQPDDFRSQPSGNAGAKIACGLIRKVKEIENSGYCLHANYESVGEKTAVLTGFRNTTGSAYLSYEYRADGG